MLLPEINPSHIVDHEIGPLSANPGIDDLANSRRYYFLVQPATEEFDIEYWKPVAVEIRRSTQEPHTSGRPEHRRRQSELVGSNSHHIKYG
jgi:hypothetical protein